MAAEPASIESALASLVGDDHLLLAELRGAFLEGARTYLAAMERASDLHDRQAAAWRLHGLAASFGATVLMDRAADVAGARRLDPALMMRVHAALEALAR